MSASDEDFRAFELWGGLGFTGLGSFGFGALGTGLKFLSLDSRL